MGLQGVVGWINKKKCGELLNLFYNNIRLSYRLGITFLTFFKENVSFVQSFFSLLWYMKGYENVIRKVLLCILSNERKVSISNIGVENLSS